MSNVAAAHCSPLKPPLHCRVFQSSCAELRPGCEFTRNNCFTTRECIELVRYQSNMCPPCFQRSKTAATPIRIRMAAQANSYKLKRVFRDAIGIAVSGLGDSQRNVKIVVTSGWYSSMLHDKNTLTTEGTASTYHFHIGHGK